MILYFVMMLIEAEWWQIEARFVDDDDGKWFCDDGDRGWFCDDDDDGYGMITKRWRMRKDRDREIGMKWKWKAKW